MPLEYRSVLAIYIMLSPWKGKPEEKYPHPTQRPSVLSEQEQTHRIFRHFRGQSHAGSPVKSENARAWPLSHVRKQVSGSFPHNPPRSGLASADVSKHVQSGRSPMHPDSPSAPGNFSSEIPIQRDLTGARARIINLRCACDPTT